MSQLRILAPQGLSAQASIAECVQATPLRPFAESVLALLGDLSARLMREPAAKQHAELVALGFWLRPANLAQLAKQQASGLHKALGLVVHFTPSNVDSMFVYSWVCSLLMGNNNIVRLASADSAAKQQLIDCLADLFALPEYAELATRNLFVSYDKQSACSAELSMLADARVLWGGDASVSSIRALPCQARCRDISFADRYSAALINGDALTDETQLDKLASLLWRDTQPHQQQACSSPRVILWLGSTDAQQALFNTINQLAIKQGSELNQLNNHLVVSQMIQSGGAAGKPWVQHAICALPVSALRPEFLDWHLGSGLYLVKSLSQLDELKQLTDSKLQTLSYWQVEREALLKLVADPSIKGIDRVVPVGRALEFSPDWDGYQLFNALSRSISWL